MATRYLLHFAHEHLSFRWPEFLALAAKNGCKFDLISPEQPVSVQPFVVIQLKQDSEEGSLIKSAHESYLLKDLYELWAVSKLSIEDLAEKASQSKHFGRCRSLHSSDSSQSFKVNCESFGVKLTQSTKIQMIDKMFFINSFEPAPLNLNNPRHTYCIFLMNIDSCDTMIDKEASSVFFFGRHLARSSRATVDRFSLKRRKFIANTSMDPLLSLIAANTAKVEANDLVFDPFVGSGSLLVAAAALGAYVLGADIDWQLLHGKSKPSRKGMKTRQEDESVRANLRQYDLESRYLDIIVSDISRHGLRPNFKLDAIIADPPYGIRESSERIGRKQRDSSQQPDDKRVKFPSKVNYHTADLITDLLYLSVNHLRLGGRLVYYLPVTFDNTGSRFEDFLPSHPDLELVAFCDQMLTKTTYRLMVVMEKKSDEKGNCGEITVPPALLNMDFRGTYFKEFKNFGE